MRQVKKVFLMTPIFFPKNQSSIQVHIVHEHFLSINLGLTAVKLINTITHGGLADPAHKF